MNYVRHVPANIRNEKSSLKSFILFSNCSEGQQQKKTQKGVKLRKNDKGTSRNDAAKWNWQKSRDAWRSMLWMRNELCDSDTLEMEIEADKHLCCQPFFGPFALSSYYSNWNRFSMYFSHFFHRNWNSRPDPSLIHTIAIGVSSPRLGIARSRTLCLRPFFSLDTWLFNCFYFWQIVVSWVRRTSNWELNAKRFKNKIILKVSKGVQPFLIILIFLKFFSRSSIC